MTNLVILVGLPGSGKSMWAKTFFEYDVVSLDKISKDLSRVFTPDTDPWGFFYYRIEERLKHNICAIADANFLLRTHRKQAQEVAADCKAKIHAVVFTDCKTAHQRNDERRGKDKYVPESVMNDMQDLYWDTMRDLPFEKYDTVTYVERFL